MKFPVSGLRIRLANIYVCRQSRQMVIELSCYANEDTSKLRVYSDVLLMPVVPRVGEEIEIMDKGVRTLYSITSVRYAKELHPDSQALDRWVVHVDACATGCQT